MIDKKCIICESSNCNIFPNKFLDNNLLRCQKCGLIFVHPQPEFSELKKIYDHNYFENNNSNSIGYEDYLKDKPNIIKTFEKRLKNIEKLHQNKGKILDLGCATGFFLEVAKNHGFDTYGVEISSYASNIAKKSFKNKIFNGALAQADFPNNFFDIITMWDYLEHIPNPSKEISTAWKLLKKNGLIILSTPEADSLAHKIFKQKWMGYKDKEHLYYFSEKNITMLLEKNGFKVLKKERIGKYITSSVLIKRLSLYSKFLSSIFNFLISKTKLLNFSFYINPLDIICVYAKKQ